MQFEHLFKDFGFYEVLVDVFNDVSHVTTTTNVEVRQASFHVTVQVTKTTVKLAIRLHLKNM